MANSRRNSSLRKICSNVGASSFCKASNDAEGGPEIDEVGELEDEPVAHFDDGEDEDDERPERFPVHGVYFARGAPR